MSCWCLAFLRRNRALIALVADATLRKEELRRLTIADLDFTARMIRVQAGKDQRDGVAFFGDAKAALVRAWLIVHPAPQPAAILFVTREGVLLGPWAIARILHLLSRRAGLERPIGPHALRHYAVTALLRRSQRPGARTARAATYNPGNGPAVCDSDPDGDRGQVPARLTA